MDTDSSRADKLQSPSAERNKKVIAEVLSEYLPKQGTVLEIASGTGQHISYFAGQFPNLDWQPSDCENEKSQSILQYREDVSVLNLKKPVLLDVLQGDWFRKEYNFILNINMIHISPRKTVQALFEGASSVLRCGERVFLYGPFFERQVETATSNLTFNQWLQSKNPDYSLRKREEVESTALSCGFEQIARIEMPANNLSLVFEKT